MKIKKENSKKEILLILNFILLFFMIGIVSAQNWPVNNVCCEKVDEGGWCQNVLDIGSCDRDYLSAPTRCDSTSFCQLGCCLASSEGICMERSPRRVCEIDGGTWINDGECNVPQCALGCCVLGDQASFVTLTRCKRMSGFLNLPTDFRSNIEDEESCSEIAYLQDNGACVYEFEFQRNCKFVTRQECLGLKGESEKEFYKNSLCTDQNLSTICAPTSKTMCVEGRDEVYFADNCGNHANIYNSDMIFKGSFEEWEKNEGVAEEIKEYWSRVILKEESCGAGGNNAGSSDCGNCDYYLGSICSEGKKAVYGDFYCRSLACPSSELYDEKDTGKDHPDNGESWCESQGEVEDGGDLVGSRYFRHICIYGEEIIEPCSDYRNEICIESLNEGTEFIEAACRTNRWEDCIDQDNEYDCANTDRRDCYWAELRGEIGKPGESKEGSQVRRDSEDVLRKILGNTYNEEYLPTAYKCLPRYPPGLKFWGESDAVDICSLASETCEVDYEGKLIPQLGEGEKGVRGEKGGWKDDEGWLNKVCVGNCHCARDDWMTEKTNFCVSLGDCGAYVNIAGKATDRGIKYNFGGKQQTINEAILKSIVKEKSGGESFTWVSK